jgi:nucleoside-triphosphatase THEP1
MAMDRYSVRVTVEGVPNSGKTTVAMLIEKALIDYGFNVEANLRFIETDDGNKFEDMSVESYQKKMDSLFAPTYRDSVTNKRKVTIKQRNIRRDNNVGP